MNTANDFAWKFQRLGGLDQATLLTAQELCRLGELDPKLWAVLSCPASGLEFDARTLALIDTDHDGRIRIPEVLNAVTFACSHLRDPAAMVSPGHSMPLDLIQTDTYEGRRLKDTALAILSNLGRDQDSSLNQNDVAEASAKAAENEYNGDGIVPPLLSLSGDVRQYIQDALDVTGGVMDASGKPGINRTISDAFSASLSKWLSWKQTVSSASAPLGSDTPEAWELLQELKAKIDDYFLRCDMAAFAPNSTECLNAWPETEAGCSIPTGNGLLDPTTLAELPLARVGADRPLQVPSAVNPAWREKLVRFFSLIAPFLDSPQTLTRDAWALVQEKFHSYTDALALKPALSLPDVTVLPSKTFDSLGEARIQEILDSGVSGRFADVAEHDASVPAALADIAVVERLVLYYLHLYRLLMNFVSFYDFYSLRRNASFQSGVLYMDGRSCRLCLPVQDAEKHAALASFSQLCLLYCQCRRSDPANENKEQTMTITAAMTAGDADLLMEGRNGVFVDTLGQDWDATLVKMISNPISIWQAIWQPYKRLGRMVTEQLTKFAGSKQEAITASAVQKLESAGASLSSSPPPAASAGFDIGRSVGIFAAIGLAIGAIGTALASIASALFSLSWWQFPLIIFGLFILVSGPSFILAWLKLRKRTLGPLLEASGWAVNSHLPINLTLGKALTASAALPPNATRSFKDPLAKPDRKPLYLLLLAVAAGAIAAWLWFNPALLDLSWINKNNNPVHAVPADGTNSPPAHAQPAQP